jgi:hypothetical protein
MHYRDSESWRKAVITLLCDIETAIEDFVVNENLWDRTGTTLSPHYANDNVDIGVGILTAGQLLINATSGLGVAMNTVDGADNANMTISGGGLASTTRGAYILLAGNESGALGKCLIASGGLSNANAVIELSGTDATYGNILFSPAATERWKMNVAGHLVFTPVAATQHSDIIASTADGADNRALFLSGGGASNNGTRGAHIELYGNEYGTGNAIMGCGAVASAYTMIDAPATSSGNVHITTASAGIRWTFDGSGNLNSNVTNGNNLVFAKVGTATVDTLTTKTALGSTQADATALTATHFTLVAGADAAKGVKFPAYASYTVGQTILIHNNSASALLLYSNAAGDLINDVAGTTAYSIAAHVTAVAFLYDATHMYIS